MTVGTIDELLIDYSLDCVIVSNAILLHQVLLLYPIL